MHQKAFCLLGRRLFWQTDNKNTFQKMPKHLLTALLAMLLTACGVDSHHFKLKGRILNMNQGEFYVYDTEGVISGIDTIQVAGGRFTMEIPCSNPATLMLVFPNFSEQPIFARPGKTVTVEGDASHLKELKVTGTKDNELMTSFRQHTAQASPPEMKKEIKQLVADYPESMVGNFLVRKYFIATEDPDYAEAHKLITILRAKQPNNTSLIRTANLIEAYAKVGKNATLPVITDYDINGRLVSSSDYSGPLALIYAWATWNYESAAQLRRIKDVQRKSKGKLKVLSIALDASKDDCERRLKQDSIPWQNICDGQLFDGRTVKRLGLMTVPDNILLKNGRVIARSLPTSELLAKIEDNL